MVAVLALLFGVIFIDCRGDSRIALGPSGTPVPTGLIVFLDLMLVGEDIILPSFIKISLRFARDAEGVIPYRF